MTVSDLAEKLKSMPQDADVKYFWDSAARTTASEVYLSRMGNVVISDGDEQSYCINEYDQPQRYA